ncbi:2-amino-4-hydroxy-6-hydroxymethyldihydropteridine diphosphokinase [Alkalihalophilus pseudofirmus]|uniref:2-amino-4-hydroxy-6- hydroxymethyldihydropteridine diphosphokinase n=1 Tax=Alkalihalophilus pseudofirmus TaxID=79885 RepID=UPI000952076B|nr:2-amino-4-hydroxy-6-hydroxymethyldihydropteridine diphosphokinase [Alkalihalophilus pseudofirmus]OLS34524.1 2-amino-4-hydroxy-6-hydroxymethyldihydropteridine diphosphokinase [Alkalihalophilus pseudofirmus]WEG17059.1 2-amino-4-hydroxy-6-hydroxymethyldihydropteridine diphosphokinase [Alkalihalophilus pseudofirmus]
MKHNVYIALGSNIGDRAAYLEEAIDRLDKEEDIKVVKRSSIYETEPVGYVDQQSFLNMVIQAKTNLSPEKLLEMTQSIEDTCGRKRDIRWGPRTIDLDILLFDQQNMKVENLCIPHPRMWERAFVIVPLYELNSELYFQSRNQTIKDIYEALPDKEGVNVWKSRVGAEGSEHFES